MQANRFRPTTSCAIPLLFCTVCGLILSVLVAWWSAYNENPTSDARIGVNEPPYSAVRRNEGWFFWVYQYGSEVKIMSQVFDTGTVDSSFIENITLDQGPSWSIVQQIPTSEQRQSGNDILEEARGWPMPCVVSVIGSNKYRVGWQIFSGIKFGSHSIYPGCPRVLPIKPILFGLFVDTMFYGIITWFLIRILASIRSVIRAKRGLCRGCGYTMHTLTQCPECGLPITKQKIGASNH